METEDDNLIGYSTGCSTIVGTGLMFTDYTTTSLGTLPNLRRMNSDGSLVIPKYFDMVLKKSIAGLVNVKIESYESWMEYNGVTFESELTGNIFIELLFDWNLKGILSKDEYEEKINMLFKMTHPDRQFNFTVNRIMGGENDTHKEFVEFFS